MGEQINKKESLPSNIWEGVEEILGIKLNNQYVTYTSHQGNDFNLYEKSLKDWTDSDNPLGTKDI